MSSGDIHIYIANQFLIGIPRLPEYYMDWSSDDRLKVNGIAEFVGKPQYEKTHHYFHINDAVGEIARGREGYDPLYKVRPHPKKVHLVYKCLLTLYICNMS